MLLFNVIYNLGNKDDNGVVFDFPFKKKKKCKNQSIFSYKNYVFLTFSRNNYIILIFICFFLLLFALLLGAVHMRKITPPRRGKNSNEIPS